MTAREIAIALGGRRASNGWLARCPAHEDGTPSFSISASREGKVLVHCHAGCQQRDVVAALRDRGLWDGGSAKVAVRKQGRHPQSPPPDDRKRTAYALKLWCETQPAERTLAETYLRHRALRLPVPRTLRFHPGLKHPDGETWPAMVGLVTRGPENRPVGIHRTFLARDGKGKAPVASSKMLLGPYRGGAVRLAPLAEWLMVGEGIETCLAAIQAVRFGAWAALSTSGLQTLELPPNVRDVTILADGDKPGEAAAEDAAKRWAGERRRVRIARPPEGTDFNDLLRGIWPSQEDKA
jgi:hypothetical protein